MKRVIVSVVFLQALCGILAQEAKHTLTFVEAVETALSNNESIRQAVLHRRQAEAEIKANRTLRLPQVSLNASYVILSDDISIDMTGVRDAITPLYSALSQYGNFSGVPNPDPNTSGMMPVLPDNISTEAVRGQLAEGLVKVQGAEWDKLIQKQQFGTVSAGVTWPLFTGGKINAANNAARIRLDEAVEMEREKTAALLSELVERYFGLSLAIEAANVRLDVLKAIEEHLADAQKLFDEGMLARAELLHAQVYHAEAEREYRKAARQVDLLNKALANTLADSTGISYLPVTPLFYNESVEPAEFFKLQSVQNNPLLRQVYAKQGLAGQAAKAERSDLMPTVAAFGLYNIADYDLSPQVSDYVAGITLSWKIFGGTSARHKYKAARLLEDQVEQAKNKAVRDIEMGIEKYHQELYMAVEQLHELKTAAEFADEYYRVRLNAFSEGLASSTDVTDASLAVAKVRVEQLQAKYNYDLTLARLLELAGIPEYFNTYMNTGVK
jgi:outer membrane protein TolC